MLMSGCATGSGGASVGVSENIDSNLPQILGLKSMTSSDEVGLEWESHASDPAVKGFAVYRLDQNGNRELLATLSKYATHFVDTGLQSGSAYRYMVRTLGDSGISNDGTMVIANTAKALNSVSFAKAIKLDGVNKLIWRPHTDIRVKSYIIERNRAGANSYSTLAKLNGRLNAEYIDTSIDMSKEYEYRISVKTITGETSAPTNGILAE